MPPRPLRCLRWLWPCRGCRPQLRCWWVARQALIRRFGSLARVRRCSLLRSSGLAVAPLQRGLWRLCALLQPLAVVWCPFPRVLAPWLSCPRRGLRPVSAVRALALGLRRRLPWVWACLFCCLRQRFRRGVSCRWVAVGGCIFRQLCSLLCCSFCQ